MAVDVFLKIEGVQGESKDSKFADEIDVIRWSWGGASPRDAVTKRATGRVILRDITITKLIDRATPVLMQAMATNRKLDTVEIICRKAGKVPLEYYKLKMIDARVVTVTKGGDGGSDRFTEDVVFCFAKLKETYVVQGKLGSSDKTIEAEFDVTTQT